MNRIFEVMPPELARNIGWTLIHFLWQGTALAVMLLALLAVSRRSSPQVRYTMACLVLLVMALAPFATFAYLQYRIHVVPTLSFSTAQIVHESVVTFPATPSPRVASMPQPTEATNARFEMTPVSTALENALPWLAVAWFVAVAILSLRLFVAWIAVERLKGRRAECFDAVWDARLKKLVAEMRISRPIRILKSAFVEVPTVFGWLGPVILIPVGAVLNLSAAQLEAIIAHELAHIRRHDYAIHLLQKIVETFLFYHPAVWWVSRVIEAERENCCDDLTVAVCGNRIEYARALAVLEEWRSAPAGLSLGANGGPLLERIRRLLQVPSETNRSGWWAAGCIVLFAVAGFCFAGRNPAKAADQPGRSQNATATEPKVFPEEKNGNVPTNREALSESKPSTKTNLAYTGKGRQLLYRKLDQIVLDQVGYDGVPLSEVVKDLSDQARRRDPEKRGVNFIINSLIDIPPAPAQLPQFDASGQPLPARPAQEAVDLNKVIIHINQPLRDIRLADVIDEISKAGDKPLNYSVEDYAVVFTQRTVDQPALFTREFKVDPATFISNLKDLAIDSRARTNFTEAARYFIRHTGVDLPAELGEREQAEAASSNASRKALIANGITGTIMVRATTKELELIETAIQVVNAAPPLVRLEVKMVELSDSDASQLGFGEMLKGAAAGTIQITVKDRPPYFYLENRPVTFEQLKTNLTERARQNPEIVVSVSLDKAAPISKFVKLIDAAKAAGIESHLRIHTSGSGAETWEGGANQLAVFQATNRPPMVAQTGVLTETQYRTVIRALEQRSGTDVLSIPSVVTPSGRAARIELTEQRTIVVGMNTATNSAKTGAKAADQPKVTYQTKQMTVGPTVEIIPYVSPDGVSIKMDVKPSVVEFLGYDDPGPFLPSPQSSSNNPLGKPLTAVLPLPRFRLRSVAGNVSIKDGQTAVLDGGIATDTVKFKDKVPVLGDLPLLGRFFRHESTGKVRKNLILFVTPRIVDPAGNRVHTPVN